MLIHVDDIHGIDIENFNKFLTFVSTQFENESMRGAIVLSSAWIDFVWKIATSTTRLITAVNVIRKMRGFTFV